MSDLGGTPPLAPRSGTAAASAALSSALAADLAGARHGRDPEILRQPDRHHLPDRAGGRDRHPDADLLAGRRGSPGARIGRAALALLLLGVAACEDQPQVEVANSYYADVPAELTAARGAGKIFLEVEGAERLGDPATVRQAAWQAMQGKPGSLNPDYTLDRGQAGQTERYVRLLIDPPQGLTGQAICRAITGQNQDERTRIALGFCWNERALSTIRGSAPKLAGPEDRYFKDLLEMAARDLFPKPARD